MRSTSSQPMLTAYRVLARNLPNTSVVMYDRNLHLLLAEGNDLPVLGFSHDRTVGYSLFEALPPEIALKYEPYLRDALRGQRTLTEERFGDRRSIYQIEFTPALADDGSVFGGLVICQNVTAQRSAETKLRESESRHRALMRAMPDTLLLLDAGGSVVDVIQNTAAPEIANGQPVIPGISIRDLHLPEIIVRRVFDLIERALRSEQLETSEIELGDDEAQPYYAELRCVPLSQAQVMVLVRDITELRKTQHTLEKRLDELTMLHARLSELEQLKTDMLRLGAHDLRSPLMVIQNYARYLAEDLSAASASTQMMQYVSEIIDAAERMKVISRDILDAERIETLLEMAALDPVEYVGIIKEATNGLRPNASLKQHTITLVAPDYPLHGRGDEPMLREAAGNLISNAIKYTPDGGNIDIVVRDIGSFFEFSVTDNGYGIPVEAQDRLFQPLARAGSKEARRIAGTGFGLFLVKRIIERHGGVLFFDSRLGHGSVFGFRLPLAAD